MDHLDEPVNLLVHVFGWRRKPEKTHTDTERTCELTHKEHVNSHTKNMRTHTQRTCELRQKEHVNSDRKNM